LLVAGAPGDARKCQGVACGVDVGIGIGIGFWCHRIPIPIPIPTTFTGDCIFEAVPHAPMAHPVTHENVEAARRPFLSNYCCPGALLGAPTLLAIFEAVSHALKGVPGDALKCHYLHVARLSRLHILMSQVSNFAFLDVRRGTFGRETVFSEQ
jgi:hypothetical protein